ncbi:hypothetical protein GH714_003124 [Hevea brasiliensis]|uniref:Cellulose synthase n=1 Tax=Hevea brasiliensis TaxID=3981 RepID=A0A6A6KX49_HEVBR|nr:hypothetical protein GH714_003124 [Hevea brasiliensis]
MESEGESGAKPMKNVGGQVCQICGDNVGKTVDGDPFVACNVCAFPVCRPCYEYERKDGNQSCPQCKTRYKRQKGSPATLDDREEDDDADDGASDFNYSSANQNQKQKIAERMLSWQMTYGRGLGCIHFAANVRVDPVREFGSSGLGNVAWKERVDGWKMKQEKNVVPMSTGQAPSERGIGDIDASTDVLVDESLLNDEARQPLSRKFPKWLPVNRETYLDRLALRYDREGEPSQLAAVDIFVSTVDPLKEPPLVTANTVLSILAVDYPVDKSLQGNGYLFAKKYHIEPRAPEWYFAQKIDYLKDKVQQFVKDRRAMKREYEEFKVRINGLVAKATKVPEEGWIMQDGTHGRK